jgi:hypothetical protein
MQFDPLRAFPYPVLRPDVDDYIDGELQVDVDFENDVTSNRISVEVQCFLSVPEIEAVIKSGHAEFAIIVACRDTYFRETIRSQDTIFSAEFPEGSLRGEVVVYPFVVVKNKIADFQCKWINDEFGDGPFKFDVGAILALDQPQTIFIDRDAFKPVSSCFTLVKSENVGDYEWRINCDADKVCIEVSPYLKAKIDNARNDKTKKAILLNSIYFAAVVQCLNKIKSDEDLEQKWANIMLQRIDELELSLEKNDEIWVAQRLMKQPISILDAYVFGDED